MQWLDYGHNVRHASMLSVLPLHLGVHDLALTPMLVILNIDLAPSLLH